MNTLIRSAGGSLGTQVVAGILADSTTAADPLPAAHSYTTAFLAVAAGVLVAALAGIFVPRAAVPGTRVPAGHEATIEPEHST